jgi:hypothetical protein
MCPQTQQLKPTCRSATHRRDQFLHSPVLRFRVTASDDRPQLALAESFDLRGLVESKERLSDLIRQSQRVHDLRDTRTGKAPRFWPVRKHSDSHADSGNLQANRGGGGGCRAAVWLASDDADYFTGPNLYVDGGMPPCPGFGTCE